MWKQISDVLIQFRAFISETRQIYLVWFSDPLIMQETTQKFFALAVSVSAVTH